MATSKKEEKIALLLQPTYPLTERRILKSIHVVKEKGQITYDTEELENGEINRYYGTLPKPAKTALYCLSDEGLANVAGDLKFKHQLQRSGVDFDTFFTPAYTRKVLEIFETFKPFASLVKWYHFAPNPATGNMMKAPCSFSVYKPLLKFEVVQAGEALLLKTTVTINNEDYDLNGFRRFYFLLESRNEYFLLAHKDFQTLEWLEKNDPAQYSLDPVMLVEKILVTLEESYPVNRNDLFAITTIETEPLQKVLLSEISNSFLVFTPQWEYDGYKTEGVFKEHFELTVKGEAIRVKRNRESETAFLQKLESLHPNFPKQINGYYYLSFADAQKKQWFLKVYHQLLEMDVKLLGMDMLTHFRYSAHKPTIDMVQIGEGENTLRFKLSVSFGDEAVPLNELQKILLAGQRAVMLKDGTMGILNEEWLAQYATMIKHGKIDKKEIRVPKWMAISEHSEENQSDALQVTIKEDWWERWKRWQQTDEVIYPVPAQIQASLRVYQHKGYEWMKLLSELNAGACLADDMGLGKTLQTICFIADVLQNTSDGKALIICPSSLIYNWQQELEKFAPYLRTYVHHGADRNIEKVLAPGENDVIITSYGTLRSEVESLAETVFEIAVIDESHNIKNPAAQITRAVNQVQAINRIALSGTPVMNNTFDLYSQLQFLLPGMFGSREFFKREYADEIDRNGDPEKTAALQKITSPFILRRTKEQVAKDLPAKTESVLWCTMGPRQKEMYEGILDSIRSNIFLNIKNEGLGKSKLAVLQGIMKLKQVCNSPFLLPQEEQTASESVKTEILLNELANLKNNKVLIFSQFSKMLDLLAGTFTKKGISFYKLDGQTPAKERSELVANFQQEDNTTNVFLISLKAGNAGLTLTAADYVFLFDPWWNNAVQQQAIDRTHRIGQTKNVFAYKMICKDTIEEKIIGLQKRKKDLSENIIGDNEGFVKELTREDVEYLFS